MATLYIIYVLQRNIHDRQRDRERGEKSQLGNFPLMKAKNFLLISDLMNILNK